MVNSIESSCRGTCQKPDVASSFVRPLAPSNLAGRPHKSEVRSFTMDTFSSIFLSPLWMTARTCPLTSKGSLAGPSRGLRRAEWLPYLCCVLWPWHSCHWGSCVHFKGKQATIYSKRFRPQRCLCMVHSSQVVRCLILFYRLYLLYTAAKWPFLWHFLHLASFAGHSVHECLGGLQHLPHCLGLAEAGCCWV